MKIRNAFVAVSAKHIPQALFLRAAALSLLVSSCAQLHHVQISDIDNRQSSGAPFSVKVSETGVNLQEAASVAKSMTRNKKAREDIDNLESIIALFQMGPRTGNMVFDVTYAEGILDLVKSECQSGKITGLTSIRETRKYPVISGEIIKINGYCLQ